MNLENLRKYLSILLTALTLTGPAIFFACNDDPIGPVVTQNGQDEGDEGDSTD